MQALGLGSHPGEHCKPDHFLRQGLTPAAAAALHILLVDWRGNIPVPDAICFTAAIVLEGDIALRRDLLCVQEGEQTSYQGGSSRKTSIQPFWIIVQPLSPTSRLHSTKHRRKLRRAPAYSLCHTTTHQQNWKKARGHRLRAERHLKQQLPAVPLLLRARCQLCHSLS